MSIPIVKNKNKNKTKNKTKTKITARLHMHGELNFTFAILFQITYLLISEILSGSFTSTLKYRRLGWWCPLGIYATVVFLGQVIHLVTTLRSTDYCIVHSVVCVSGLPILDGPFGVFLTFMHYDRFWLIESANEKTFLYKTYLWFNEYYLRFIIINHIW